MANTIKFYIEDNTIFCKMDGDFKTFKEPAKNVLKSLSNGWQWDGVQYLWYQNLNIDYDLAKITVQSDYEAVIKKIPNADKEDFVKIANELKKRHDHSEITFELLPELKLILMPHQIESMHRCYNQDNKILLAHEMGSGKTLTALSIAYQMSKKCFIVVPKSILSQWKDEIKKWHLSTEDKIFIMNGDKEDNLDKLTNRDYTHYILNYEKLRFLYKPENKWTDYERDLNAILEKFPKEEFVLIYDEMYKIKNYKSQLNRAHMKFRDNYWFAVVGLSGTPMENSLWDAYTTVNMIAPNVITKQDMFKYFVIDTGYGFRFRNFNLFNKMLKNLMHRVTKKEIRADLPELVQEYKFVENTSKAKVLEATIVGNADSVFSIYTTLRVMDSYIEDDGKNKFFEGVKTIEHTNKWEELESILEEIGENKVLIFTSYAKTAIWLADKLSKANYKATAMYADIKDKEKIKNDFVNGDLQIVVATAVWERGVDLPDIDYLVNFDFPINPSVYAQRINRIFRINSGRPKLVVNLISDTIEKDVYEIVKGKIVNIEKAVEGNVTDDQIIKALAEKWGMPALPVKEKKDAKV